MNSNGPVKQDPESTYPNLLQYTMSSDSEWSTSSNCSFSASPAGNSPMPSPMVYPLSAPVTDGTDAAQGSYFSFAPTHYRSPPYASPPTSSHYREVQSSPLPRFSRSKTGKDSKTDHVPRPMNAFMLFRSDFLKRRVIPAHAERRQQNLSRVAGEIWNMMKPEEKKTWKDKAARTLQEHRHKHPNYKFTPARRGTGRTKSQIRQVDKEDSDQKARIRELRETYVPDRAGPSVPPARRQRLRVRARKTEAETFAAATHTPLPPSIPPSPGSSLSDPLLPTFIFPSSSDLAQNHPSTPRDDLVVLKAGSDDEASEPMGLDFSRPPSVASSDTSLSGLIQDLDITPTVANFHRISMPNDSIYSRDYQPSSFPVDIENSLGLRQLQLPFDMSYDDTQPQSFPSFDHVHHPVDGPGVDTFLSSLWPDGDVIQMPAYNDSSAYFPGLETLDPELMNFPLHDWQGIGSLDRGFSHPQHLDA